MNNSSTTTTDTKLQVFDSLKGEITLFVEPCMKMTVTSKETCEAALQAVTQVKSFSKKIEERRKDLVNPLNEQVKRINGYAKGILEPLENAESHLKFVLLEWERKLEKERLEAQWKAEAERRKAEAEARAKAEAAQAEAEAMAMFMPEEDAVKVQMDAQVNGELAVMQVNFEHKAKTKEINAQKVKGVRKTWTFEVTDDTQVPREFLMVDEKKIRQAIKDGVRDIKGVRIYEETNLAVGGRS